MLFNNECCGTVFSNAPNSVYYSEVFIFICKEKQTSQSKNIVLPINTVQFCITDKQIGAESLSFVLY